MKQQNFSNHSRMVVGFHGVLFLAILALLVGSIMNLINAADENIYSASLLVLVAVILLILMYYARAFALIAQDRAIRAEEKLRYYMLTGNTLSNQLTTRQIIGLRFSPDEEFPTLVEKSIKENLSEKDIKKLIQNWKQDNYRV